MKEEFRITTPNESARYLVQLREDRGLTRAQAAEAIGCSTSTLARWERHGLSGHIRFWNLMHLANAYDVSVDTLLYYASRPTHAEVA